MVHQTTHHRYDRGIYWGDEDVADSGVAPYKFGHSARTNSRPEDPVPLFLSDYDGEPDPSEYMARLRKDRRFSVSSRTLAGLLATAAVATLFAMFSSDATRDIIVNAKDSIAASLPAPYAAARPDPAQLTVRDIQLRNPDDRLGYRPRQVRQRAFEASQRSRRRRHVRRSRRPTRARWRAALRALQRRLPHRRLPRCRLPLRSLLLRRHENSMPTNSPLS